MQAASVSIDTFYSNIEFNCRELVFDASDAPDEIRYELTTVPKRSMRSTHFFFTIIADESMASLAWKILVQA